MGLQLLFSLSHACSVTSAVVWTCASGFPDTSGCRKLEWSPLQPVTRQNLSFGHELACDPEQGSYGTVPLIAQMSSFPWRISSRSYCIEITMIETTEGAFGSTLIVLSACSVAHECRTGLCHKGRCIPRCISLLCFEASDSVWWLDISLNTVCIAVLAFAATKLLRSSIVISLPCLSAKLSPMSYHLCRRR